MAVRSPLAAHFSLDPNVIYLNHGAFGACPLVVHMPTFRSHFQSANPGLEHRAPRLPDRIFHLKLASYNEPSPLLWCDAKSTVRERIPQFVRVGGT